MAVLDAKVFTVSRICIPWNVLPSWSALVLESMKEGKAGSRRLECFDVIK